MTGVMSLQPILASIRDETPRTWSIIVTFYGDAIVPRGGSVWLGTLLDLFGAMDINGNVVRTAMSRLAADGWLARSRRGRNSYYRLSDAAVAESAAAAPRIYRPVRPAWDGTIHLAIAPDGGAEDDARSLRQAGYTALAPNVFAQAADVETPPGVIRLRATTADAPRLARLLWPDDDLAGYYRAFVALHAPLADTVGGLDGIEAMIARTLLVHHWRRIVLRDPMRPAALLPPDWPGDAAAELFQRLHAALLGASERWLDEHATCETGPLPPRER